MAATDIYTQHVHVYTNDGGAAAAQPFALHVYRKDSGRPSFLSFFLFLLLSILPALLDAVVIWTAQAYIHLEKTLKLWDYRLYSGAGGIQTAQLGTT